MLKAMFKLWSISVIVAESELIAQEYNVVRLESDTCIAIVKDSVQNPMLVCPPQTQIGRCAELLCSLASKARSIFGLGDEDLNNLLSQCSDEYYNTNLFILITNAEQPKNETDTTGEIPLYNDSII